MSRICIAIALASLMLPCAHFDIGAGLCFVLHLGSPAEWLLTDFGAHNPVAGASAGFLILLIAAFIGSEIQRRKGIDDRAYELCGVVLLASWFWPHFAIALVHLVYREI